MIFPLTTNCDLNLLHSEWPKLHRVLAILSAIRLSLGVGKILCMTHLLIMLILSIRKVEHNVVRKVEHNQKVCNTQYLLLGLMTFT